MFGDLERITEILSDFLFIKTTDNGCESVV